MYNTPDRRDRGFHLIDCVKVLLAEFVKQKRMIIVRGVFCNILSSTPILLLVPTYTQIIFEYIAYL